MEDEMEEDEFKKYERKLKRCIDWTTKDAMTVYAIKMTVRTDYLHTLATCTTSREMWDSINAKFEGEGPVQQSIYFALWANLDFNPSGNIEVFPRRFDAVWTDCIQSGLKVPSELAIFLLAKLDQHFDSWVTAKRQTLRDSKELKLQDLINEIIDENKRNQLQPKLRFTSFEGGQIELVKIRSRNSHKQTKTTQNALVVKDAIPVE